MAAPIDLYLDPLPDMGELGPRNLRITHAPCHVRMRFYTHPVTGTQQLVCPKCGRYIDLSHAMLDSIEHAAILELPSLVRGYLPGQGPEVIRILCN